MVSLMNVVSLGQCSVYTVTPSVAVLILTLPSVLAGVIRIEGTTETVRLRSQL